MFLPEDIMRCSKVQYFPLLLFRNKQVALANILRPKKTKEENIENDVV